LAAPLLLALLSLTAIGAFLRGVFAVGDAEVEVQNTVQVIVPDPTRLRIVDFNVKHGYPFFTRQEERYQDTLGALRALHADVIILQEAWRTRKFGHLVERLARDLQMNSAYARANGSLRYLGFEEGSAILSRYPLDSPRRVVASPRMPPWENRIALAVTISVADQPVSIAGAHLTFYGDGIASEQAASVAKAVGQVTVMAGDFNASSASEAVRIFTERGMVDVLPGGIDHVLVSISPEWNVAEAHWTLRPEDMPALIGRKRDISDHPGIVVDLLKTQGDG
jgi:endonuclease/exonuclease/phosphatase family metal-dependent hydrolase